MHSSMNDVDKIPVAVVGAGNMGSNHVRIYDELEKVELVEVVEADDGKAAELEAEYDVDVLSSVDDVEEAQAASVAVPNRFHREISVNLLELGLDLLVEKPLAEDVDDANAIAEAAEENDAVLQVGHIERFNPAVELLAEMLEKQEVIAFEAHRLGPFNEQLSAESVVFDLMIHDIDVVCSLVESEIDSTNAVGSRTKSDELDHVFSQFKFKNNVIGSLTASHVTHGKIRTLDVTTEDAYINLDYQKQDITIQRRGTEKTTSLLDRSGYRTEAVTENPYIKRAEPLKREVEHFLEKVRSRGDPAVGAEDGIEAVETASEIVEMVQGS